MEDLKEILPWMDGVPKAVSCSEGWDDLIRRLHDRVVGIDPNYRVTQVKEKFGGLRYYVMDDPDLDDTLRQRVWDFISEAEEESYRICEVCGEPGETRGGSWYRTLCDAHHREREAQYAALRATASDDDDDQDEETVQEELREARHEVAAARRMCPTHGLALIEESGGPDQPTLYGRVYCPECQRELMAALDEQP